MFIFASMNKYQQELSDKVKKGKNVFIADTARVLGRVELGNDVSVWFGAVIRADFDSITIGDRTNVQEGVYMHIDAGCPIKIGEDNVIGHGAILHGCTLGDSNLIGMRATIMNNAKIGKGCIIGAHALVTEGMVIPDFSMVLGTPAKVVKQLPESVIQGVHIGVEHYLDEAKKYLKSEGIDV
ncbi:MAG: gamma carbonic anhydrase family protein [Bacteroidetes bacterium]|nr:gamma carbonic anhydrase family protein [Bacteroidota bacterium]